MVEEVVFVGVVLNGFVGGGVVGFGTSLTPHRPQVWYGGRQRRGI